MFTDGAVKIIHSHSGGIPRVIKDISCIGCLIDLKARGGQVVEEDSVKRALA